MLFGLRIGIVFHFRQHRDQFQRDASAKRDPSASGGGQHQPEHVKHADERNTAVHRGCPERVGHYRELDSGWRSLREQQRRHDHRNGYDRHLYSAGKCRVPYCDSHQRGGHDEVCKRGGDGYGRQRQHHDNATSYLLHHNPFPWYSDVANSVTQQQNMYPFTQLAQDIQANTFQDFSLIIPNGVDDADEPFTTAPSVLLATADTWLKTNISPLLSTPPFQAGGDGILMIVFDEGDEDGESGDSASDDSCSPTQSTGCGGHIAFVMIGPNVNPASTTANTYQFQDMLHTIVHLLGVTDYMNGSAAGSDIALLPGVGN